MTRVLTIGIDPGPERSSMVALTGLTGLITWWTESNDELLERILACDKLAPNVVAIEMIASYGMPVGKEVFDTALWVGRFVQAWAPVKPRLIYRREVKLWLCGNVRANDGNIRAALIDLCGPGKAKAIGTKRSKGPLYGIKGDAWSALAVAMTARDAHDAR